VGKARGVAREFSRAMESAADETGLKEIDRTIRAPQTR
jgi:sec-independent protein translocase protein TatB